MTNVNIHATIQQLIINREQAAPNKYTFRIPPIAYLLRKYKVGKNWIDPFAGMYSLAEFKNDIDPDMPTEYHMDALDFVRNICTGEYDGVIFDPPYSYRQISEHYKAVARKATALDTSNNFYNRVMNAAADKIRPETGLAISCGWNSSGFGFDRGFYPIELLVVNHGQHHHDTLVLVERRYKFPNAI